MTNLNSRNLYIHDSIVIFSLHFIIRIKIDKLLILKFVVPILIEQKQNEK